MSWSDLNLLPALPEIVLLAAISLILVLDLFLSDAKRAITYRLSLLALLVCAVVTFYVAQPYPVLTFSAMYIADPMASLAKVAMIIAVAAMMVYGRQYVADRGMFRGEFYTLTLFALLGMMVMTSANSFLTLYMGLELLSLSLYALVALRRDSAVGTEAAMKYFVLGALSSGMLLYGMSMLYGATGSLILGEVAQALASGQISPYLATFGVVFIVTGVAFKLGAVPFHMWVPDVYQGAPTVVTLLVGSAPKVAAFVFTLRLLVQAMPAAFPAWQGMLVLLALASLIVGNLAAIAQTNIKRLFAYSAIAHMGFLLLGILAGTPAGYTAALFYAITYMLMSMAAFGLLILLSRAGFECETLDDLKGLNQRSSWYAVLMLLVLFSMAGIPPLVGFYAKFAVLKAVVDVNMVWLAVVGVVTSLIGAFYYLRAVKIMYFDSAEVDSPAIVARGEMKWVLSINALALLVLGVMPNELYNLCVEAMRQSLQVL